MNASLPKMTAFVAVMLMTGSAIIAAIPAGAVDGDAQTPGPNIGILDPRLLNSTYDRNGPIIDGVISPREWEGAEPTSALHSQIPPAWEESGGHIEPPGIQNDSDASHTFWSMYNEDYLYFLFNCSDDQIFVDSYPDSFWRDDGIEICIDGAHDMDVNQRTDEGFEDGDTFAVPADGSDGITYSQSASSPHARSFGRNDDWFSAVTVHNTSGPAYYIVEVMIRLNAIWNPTPGSMVGLNTGQNDDDDGGITKEGVIRWQGLDGYRVWENETLWGNLYFRTAINADAGVPQATIDQGETYTFDASKSWANHPDFNVVGDFNWSFMYDDQEVTLSGVKPSFQFDIPGIYVVSLNVTDGTGQFDTDKVTLLVRDTEAPVADAGPDIEVDQHEQVDFDASNSTDNDPDFPEGAEFHWSFITREVVKLSGITANHTFHDAGEYDVTLTVTDDAGLWDTDKMKVYVADVTPPVANAGADVTVDYGRNVNFDGTNSTDNVGILTYHWEFEWDDEIINFTGSRSPYRFSAPGVYNVTLTVHDEAGFSDSDSMTVTITDVTPPEANAGEKYREINEDVEVTFNAELSWDDVAIASYGWTVFHGAEEVAQLEGRKAKHTFIEPGLYDVVLRVEDTVGLWSEDTVQYSVRDVTEPVASAGENRVVDEDDPVPFSASNSSDNVEIIRWEWTISSEGEPDVRRTGEEFEYVFAMPGEYDVTLVVTDREGLWDSHTVKVVVNDVTAPEARAPPSTKVKVGQTLEFDGRSSTDNVGVVKYHWHYEMTGAPFDLYTSNITVTFDAQGNHTITLTVEDAAGNTDTETFYVEVEKPEKKEEEPGFIGTVALVALCAVTVAAVVRRRAWTS